ncbi:MAG: long-chain fatty acid--CoA ligase [Acidimicrobiia bacterium]
MSDETIVKMFHEQVERLGDRAALKRRRQGGLWESITWNEYYRAVREFGLGLVSMGFEPGQMMAVFSNNRPEWHMADLGCMTMGGVTVPIYQTSASDQIVYILNHSEARYIVCENTGFAQKILDLREKLETVQRVVLMDGSVDDDFVVGFDEVRKLGRELDSQEPKLYEERSSAVSPDDLATLVYTSGTTGMPKGVELTHGNIAWTVRSLQQVVEANEYDRSLSFLPLSHILERLVSHFSQIANGTTTWFAESIDTLVRDLQDCQPTIMVAVPRVWEKAYNRIKEGIEESTGLRHTLATKAIELGLKAVEAEQAGRSIGILDALQLAVFDRLVFSKIRSQLGMNSVRMAFSGAAPLNTEVCKFFHAIGVRIREGYGQTEDCGPTSVNPAEKIKIGTVGPPIPGVTVKIAEDGEILVKGGNVFRGYYKNPEATSETLIDGWLHSGDIGTQDDDGYLTITDRKKDLIITAGGKNVAPQELESRLQLAPLIDQAVVVGDGRKFLAALITLDQEAAEKWAASKGKSGSLSELVNDEDLQAEVQKIIDEVNSHFSSAESIKKFKILDKPFTIDGGEITPTLKVRRRNIVQKYASLIEEIYAS